MQSNQEGDDAVRLGSSSSMGSKGLLQWKSHVLMAKTAV